MHEIWNYNTTYHTPCKLIDSIKLWNKTVCRVWLPDRDVVVQVPEETLVPLEESFDAEKEKYRIYYISAAAKISHVLQRSIDGEEKVLLAPIESNVIPLPHQVSALERAISSPNIRYLIADEVGLGKTIEAGLIMRELKLRGMVRRVLVIAPKSIATQWVAEMRTHFDETFHLVLGDEIETLKQVALAQGNTNPWSVYDQVVVTLDAVKPLVKRRGWDDEKIAAHNADRYESLMSAGWDLIVVDEAHRLGGSSEQVARHKLGRGLAEAAPYLLLLTATPHQGKRDAFWRLMSLLDSTTFIDEASVTREKVREFTIRTEKRKAIDGEGKPLFKPRKTRLLPVRWDDRHFLQKKLYHAVTEYVREGYNQALLQNKQHIGFLMVLMQRLVVSSTRAIRTTLEKRLELLKSDDVEGYGEVVPNVEEYYDADAQELLEELLQTHRQAMADEAEEVSHLLELAREAEIVQSDAKAEALIDEIYRLQSEEGNPHLKVLIFTEFVPTQQMLSEFLEERGFTVTTLNGSMSMEERQAAQEAFATDARILISTDAGGEGLNLQFCHIVINYDLPWNPMRLEQRIGRVDRIGQEHTVQAINLVFEESVEYRVREVLEEKLSIIFEEFGVDKTADVLDSAEAGEIFEELFSAAIVHPENIEEHIDKSVKKVKEEIEAIRSASEVYAVNDEHNPEVVKRLRTHPLPYWVERMTVAYLKSKGAEALRKDRGWELRWPDGTAQKRVSFNNRDAMKYANTKLLNLENPRVRSLMTHLPSRIDVEPLPIVQIPELPSTVSGIWGLFEISLQLPKRNFEKIRAPIGQRGFITLFISDDGRFFGPTSRHIWELLQTTDLDVIGFEGSDESERITDILAKHAMDEGEDLWRDLEKRHREALNVEKERGEYAFASRQQAIMRVGLEEVRNFRLKALEKEKKQWHEELTLAGQIVPQLRALLAMRVKVSDV